MNKPFLLCPKCDHWGYIPDNFNERKHFGVCPKCDSTMRLLQGLIPEECGFSLKKKVEIVKLRPAK